MSKRRGGAHHEEEHENHERWLVSYADMMTLLFALFLVLYAMGIADLKKYQAFRQAFTESLYDGVQSLPEEGNPPIGDPHLEMAGGSELSTTELAAPVDSVVSPTVVPPASDEVTDPSQLEALKEQLEAAIAAVGLSQQVSVALDERGVAVYVTDGVLFDSGQARIKDEGRHLLDGLTPILSGVGNKLIVEGHTDDVPISSSSFPSNWELSTARGTAVLHGLLSGGIEVNRVSVAGYAETRPRVPNDTPQNRAVNRRVEVIVAVPPAPVAPPVPAPAAPTEPAEASAAEEQSASAH